MKFLHTADWQLGMTRHFLSDDAQARYSAARLAAVGAIGRLAVAEGCEFVLVCGDVFESNQLAPQTVSRALEAMRQAKAQFYLLPGNHDPLNGASVYTSALFLAERPANVHVLDRPGLHEVRPGLSILAAPWFGKHPDRDLAAEALELAAHERPAGVVVLAAHGGIDALSPDQSAPGLMKLAELRSALDSAVVDYVALGDKHSLLSVADDQRIWYPSAPEVTNFDDVEKDSGHVLVVELDEEGVRAKAQRVGTWRFATLGHELGDAADVLSLDALLDDIPEKGDTVVRLKLRGALSLADRSALDELLERQGRRFASLRLWQRHTELVTAPQDGDFADLGLSGFVGEATQELMAKASSGGQDAQAAQGALMLLRRLASGAGAA